MKHIDIDKHPNGIAPRKTIATLAKNKGYLTVRCPMPSIHSSGWHFDITQDYLEASFLAETLGEHASTIELLMDFEQHPVSCLLSFWVNDPVAFSDKLNQLSLLMWEDQDDDTHVELAEALDDYAESLEQRALKCPQLVDDYYANLVGAAEDEIDTEWDPGFLERTHARHPERRYGFWTSAYSRVVGQPFFVSRDSWVIPHNMDVFYLLHLCAGIPEEETVEQGSTFSLDGNSYVVTRESLVHFPVEHAALANELAQASLTGFAQAGDTQSTTEDATSPASQTVSPFSRRAPREAAVGWNSPPPIYLLAKSGLFLVIDDGAFWYVFFPDAVQGQQALLLNQRVSSIAEMIAGPTGLTPLIELPWKDLDDEAFESLCYDIIYHHPRYDNNTIRKMGKSRSRDGGRDIEVFTRDRPGVPRRKFIFQCKLTSRDKSLTTQKLTNISDTINQYQAEGYGVLTSSLIDAALYDRIDAICRKFGIESDTWSVMEIERYLSRHHGLIQRHFGSKGKIEKPKQS